jgi:GAF domain-containing protein
MPGDPSAATQDTYDALSRMVVSVESTRDATMAKIAELGCGLLEACDFVSLTLIERGRPETAGATHDDAVALDEAQYDARSGPCLTAIRDQRVVRVRSLPGAKATWGEKVGQAAERLSIGSSLSAPLVVDGSCFGGLNLYSRALDAFSVADEVALSAFAEQAAAVAANARDYWAMAEATRQLESALESRAVIEQAKGVLMARQGCSPDEAFDFLRRASQRKNRKLRSIAEEIVAGATNGAEENDA